MWALRGTRSAQAALSPSPPRPKQEREAPEESNISSIAAVILHDVRMKRLFHLYLFPSPKGTNAVVAPGQGRIATLRPPPPRAGP